MRITLKEAQRIARMNGMVINRTEVGDYRVNFKKGSESSACYEETIEDALGTAKAMYERGK